MSATKSVEIVPGRLYWISDTTPPKSRTSAFYFNIDDQLVYYGFDQDFGPLNLAQTHRFCSELEALFNDKQYHGYKIYHYTSTDYKKRANAAYLMCAFQIIILGRTAEEAFKPFQTIRPPFVAFRDASSGACYYKCLIFHCIKGLECALKLKWYNYKTFNLTEYEHYEVVDNGDLNWIVPNKFMAFSGPASSQFDSDNNRTYTPEDYAPIFKKFGITTVVRLNKKQYDRERFIKKGFKHHDLYFLDGSTPSEEIYRKFLDIAESSSGGISIHCKAGLGRTGTLIALYCMKHYRIPAAYFIGWIRICRPGSILGPQQHYLQEMQERMYKEGEIFRKTRADTLNAEFTNQLDLGTAFSHSPTPGSGSTSPYDRGSMSPEDSHKAKYGDLNQADRLTQAKRANYSTPSPTSHSGSPGSIASPGTGALGSTPIKGKGTGVGVASGGAYASPSKSGKVPGYGAAGGPITGSPGSPGKIGKGYSPSSPGKK